MNKLLFGIILAIAVIEGVLLFGGKSVGEQQSPKENRQMQTTVSAPRGVEQSAQTTSLDTNLVVRIQAVTIR